MSLNPLPAAIWGQRSHFKKLTRQFFDERDFIEADTPFLVEWPSLEPHLDPYQVGMECGTRAFLSSSPEFGLKKIIGSGCPKVYELAHSYRSHERGPWHSREFIMLEWYQVGLKMEGLMDQCSELLTQLFPHLPQHRFSVEKWMSKQGFKDIQPQTLKLRLTEQDVTAVEEMDDNEAFFRCFLPTESALENMGIVFLYHYPASQCAYARVEGQWARRFEVYIQGVEVGNAFEEECQPQQLLKLLQKEQQMRQALGKDPLGIDEHFVQALAQLEEPLSGIAMGWDRLFALWSGSSSLRNSSPFLPSYVKTSDG